MERRRTKGREADPRSAEEQTAAKAAARERRDAYVRGHQLAEMRTTIGTGLLGHQVDLVSRRALHPQLRPAVLAEARPLYAA